MAHELKITFKELGHFIATTAQYVQLSFIWPWLLEKRIPCKFVAY